MDRLPLDADKVPSSNPGGGLRRVHFHTSELTIWWAHLIRRPASRLVTKWCFL